MNTVQKCGIEEVVGHKHHQPCQRLSFIQRKWYCAYSRLEGSTFWKTKWLIPTSTEAALDKHSELVNRKCIIFYQNTARPHFSLTKQKLLQFFKKRNNNNNKKQNCYNLTGKFWFILCIHQTLHLQISIYFNIYKIFLMEKYFSSLEDHKRHQ